MEKLLAEKLDAIISELKKLNKFMNVLEQHIHEFDGISGVCEGCGRNKRQVYDERKQDT